MVSILISILDVDDSKPVDDAFETCVCLDCNGTTSLFITVDDATYAVEKDILFIVNGFEDEILSNDIIDGNVLMTLNNGVVSVEYALDVAEGTLFIFEILMLLLPSIVVVGPRKNQ